MNVTMTSLSAREIVGLQSEIARLRQRVVFDLGHNAREIAKQIWERKTRIRELEEMLDEQNSESCQK
jgi:hypothetical protein